ncbi:MAG: aminoglycoside phosphotransferase family protein [Arachnia sp.]
MEVPAELRLSHRRFFGEAADDWLDAAPGLAESLLDRWELTPDGPAAHGAVAWVLPVRRAAGPAAVLKLQPIDDETVDEPLALQSWAGQGAVRLLDHDRESGSMLLERLDAARSLGSVPDDLDALQTLSVLLAELSAVPAPHCHRRLSDIGADLLERAERVLPRAADASSILRDCSAALRDVLPESGDRLLHGDLHYFNVLAPLPDAADRGPWLAIDPKPLAGDPGFELLPALHNRWDDAVATGDLSRAIIRRFDLMTDVVCLEPDRARAWTLARILQNMVWELENGAPQWSSEPDRTIAQVLLAQG